MPKSLCLTALLLLGLTGCGARLPAVATPTTAAIMQPLPPGMPSAVKTCSEKR